MPLLTPRLSSAWLSLVTDVDTATARNLIDSMTTEVIVRDPPIEQLLPGPTIGYDEAVRLALAAREAAAVAERRPQNRPARPCIDPVESETITSPIKSSPTP